MEKVEPEIGDIIFVVRGDHKLSWLQKIITKVTKGPAFHVSMYAGNGQVFETDGAYGKASYFPLTKYADDAIDVYRLALITQEDKDRIQDICKLLKGTPYSYWDIAVKFVTSPLVNNKIRFGRWLQEALGTKQFKICNELVMYILYEATLYKPFQHSEEWTPASFRELCRQLFPEVFNIVY